jgi:hypothetical protein
MSTPVAPQHSPEDVIRGAMFALLVVPVGIIVWAAISSAGFIVSIVAYGIAGGALWLYKRGSGGIITRTGAWVVTIIVVATLLIAFWVGLGAGAVFRAGRPGDLFNPAIWNYLGANFTTIVQQNSINLLLAIAIAAFGSYRVLGRAFATARATSSTTATFGTAPTLPPPPADPTRPQLNPDSTGTISSAPDDRLPPPTPRD